MKKIFSFFAAMLLMAGTVSAQTVYDVTAAIAAADAGTIAANETISVRGVITKIEFKGTNFKRYGSANIYVADATGAEGSFEFFNCYSLQADTFRTSDPAYNATSTSWAEFESVTDGNSVTVHVGDTVIAKGQYKKYNTTYELNTGCYLTDIKPYVAASDPDPDPEPEPEVNEPIQLTCDSAYSLAFALQPGDTLQVDNVTAIVEVTGFVTNAGSGMVSGGKQTFYIGKSADETAKTLQVYKGEMGEQAAVNKGDKVKITGKLMHYRNASGSTDVAELINSTVEVLSRVEVQTDTIDDKSVCEIIGVGEALAGGSYSQDFYDVTAVVDSLANTSGMKQSFFFYCVDESSAANGSTLQVYNAYMQDSILAAKGDTVRVFGKITMYAAKQQVEFESPLAWVVGKVAQQPTDTVTPDPEPDPELNNTIQLTCDSAYSLAFTLQPGDTLQVDNVTAIVEVTGFVTNAGSGMVSGGKQTFYIGKSADETAKTLQVYKGEMGEQAAVNKGDKVKITGKLMHYRNASGSTDVAELINSTVEVLSRVEVQTDTIDDKSVCEIIGVGEALAGGSYSQDFYDVTAVVDSLANTSGMKQSFFFYCVDESSAANGSTLQVYNAYMQDSILAAKGDTVRVFGKITMYAAKQQVEFESPLAWVVGKVAQQPTDTVTPEPEPAGIDLITCDSARTAALAGKTDSAYVIGYVTSISSAYNSQNNNISFWMADSIGGGQVIQAYRAACASEDAAPHIGDKVSVLGKLAKYGTTPEFAQGCTFEIIERAPVVEPQNLGVKTIAEFLQLKNFVDTCILTGVIDSVYNTQYGNFDLVDGTGSVYIYGLLTAAGESKKCFTEEGLAIGDTLTIMAIYNENNNEPRVSNAIFVSVAKKAEPEPEPQPTEEYVDVYYRNRDNDIFALQQVILTLPVAPVIEGFSFLKWVVVAGDLEDGINIQAVYTSNPETTAPAVYVNPANPAQKLIRNGNVYILHDGNTYTVSGAKVR